MSVDVAERRGVVSYVNQQRAEMQALVEAQSKYLSFLSHDLRGGLEKPAVDKIEFRVHHIVADGDVVLTERTDVFVAGDKTIELPVMGTFEVADGKIAAWRDYFDMNQFMSQLAG